MDMLELTTQDLLDADRDTDPRWQAKPTLDIILATAYDRAGLISGSPEQDDLDIERDI